MKIYFTCFFIYVILIGTSAWSVYSHKSAPIDLNYDSDFLNPNITKKISIRFDNLEHFMEEGNPVFLRGTIKDIAKDTVEYMESFELYGGGELSIEIEEIQTDHHITLTKEILKEISEKMTKHTSHGSYINGPLARIFKSSFQDFAPHINICNNGNAVLNKLNTGLRNNKSAALNFYFGHDS